MPLPLSNKKFKKVSSMETLPTCISKRPELAAKIMTVIAIWSAIESDYDQIATHCLKADFEVVVSMLNGMKSADGKRQAIATAVNEAHPEYFLLFQAIEKITKSSRKRRNDFAHHVWAISKDLPDSICLIDPKNLSKMHASVKSAFKVVPKVETKQKVLQTIKNATTTKSTGLSPDDIIVYTSKDLGDDIIRAMEASMLVTKLRVALSDSPKASQAQNELLNQPEVQRAIQGLSN